MAKARRRQFSSNVTGNEQVVAFINGLNCPLLSATFSDNTSHIFINEHLEVRGLSHVYMDGVDKGGPSRGWINPIVTVVYNDNFVYIWFFTTWGSGWTTAMGICYIKHNNLDLYGYLPDTSGENGNIYSFTFADIDNLFSYTMKTCIASYTLDVATLDYTKQYMFSGGTVKENETGDLLNCTTVTQGLVITFDGKNYFALGPNTLIILDEE